MHDTRVAPGEDAFGSNTVQGPGRTELSTRVQDVGRVNGNAIMRSVLLSIMSHIRSVSAFQI